jgi:uncharacterized membrane protein YphA (DoxX/SURF4 family)
MLSLFPELFDWSWYVPLVFRLFLGVYIMHIGWRFMRHKERRGDEEERFTWACLGMLFITLGLLFVVGLYVQALGSTGFALTLFALLLKYKKSHEASESVQFYLLLGLVSLSLVFLGPGPYAIDLPL